MTQRNLKQYLFHLLSRREYSQTELIGKLKQYTDDTTEIQNLLTLFSANHWQSDYRYAEDLIYSKKNKYGLLKLIYQLKQKGIDEAVFSPLLPPKAAQPQVAIDILTKKYRQYNGLKSEQVKYFRFLQSRGFDTDTIYQAIETWTANSAISEDN